ncbi:helix-turn-helix domain-containing protein [Flagellimonas sp.]|jgi:AraC-like DNA-binding protein|uniref:helix-turn-helix domain-containing protein n=1 Tax=Flagellimonas sp. TaxID=2058762 RepID=UPI003BAB5E24
MRYTTQISASHLERKQVKEAGQKSNIILFLIRDNDSILEASSEDRYEFIYSLEPSPDFNPSTPLIIGMYNGSFGTMDKNMQTDGFVKKSILETPLSNQLALYLVQELLINTAEEQFHLENMIITLGDYLVKREQMQSELNCTLKMGLTPFQIHKIHRYVRKHIDRPVLTSELAKVVELSIHYFIRVFKRTMGETPHQFVMRLKLEEAKKLLISTDESVIQVGLGVGCENPSHFSQLFKSNFGIPPLKFRKTFQNGMISLN